MKRGAPSGKRVRRSSNQEQDYDRYFGERLARLRKLRGLTQPELGERTGITYGQIQKYEQGTNRLSLSRLMVICSALDASPTWFIHGLGQPQMSDPLHALMEDVMQMPPEAINRLRALLRALVGSERDGLP